MILTPIALLIYLGIGALTGTLSGMLGIGGGVVIVPGLLFAFSHFGMPLSVKMHVASATSLASILFCATASARQFHRQGLVDWQIVRRFAPGMTLGTVLGACFAATLPTKWLGLIFAGFIYSSPPTCYARAKRDQHVNCLAPLSVTVLPSSQGVSQAYSVSAVVRWLSLFDPLRSACTPRLGNIGKL